MLKCSILIGIVVLGLCSAAVAEEKPTTTPTSQPVVVSVGDKQAIAASLGKEVVVEGTVSDAQWSSTGRVFIIKFKEGEATGFQGAILAKTRDAMEKAFHGNLSNAFEGAKIQIAGKLQNYREHSEIVANEPKQITIVAPGPGHLPHASATTLPSAPSAQTSTRITGIYEGMTTLSEDQRAKIAAIQKESFDAQMVAIQKIQADEFAKIDALLTDDQKQELKSLYEKAYPPRGNRSGNGD